MGNQLCYDASMKKIYTDGACSGNPGQGGWGVVIEEKSGCKEMSGFELETTNNRMEMQAVIEALRSLSVGELVEVWTDSQYVQKGMTEWMASWRRNGWKTAAGKAVKNKDLWQELVSLEEKCGVKWCWLKGHAGHPQNERADELAREAIKKGQ